MQSHSLLPSLCVVLIKKPKRRQKFWAKEHSPLKKPSLTLTQSQDPHQVPPSAPPPIFGFCLVGWKHLFSLILLCLSSLTLFSPCSSHSDLWKPNSKWLPSVPKIGFNCSVGAGKALHRLTPLTFLASYANFHDIYTPATLLSLLPLEHQTHQAISQLRVFVPRSLIPCLPPVLAPFCLKFVCPLCRGAWTPCPK